MSNKKGFVSNPDGSFSLEEMEKDNFDALKEFMNEFNENRKLLRKIIRFYEKGFSGEKGSVLKIPKIKNHAK